MTAPEDIQPRDAPDLVVIVPGLDAHRHGEALERLLDGIDRYVASPDARCSDLRIATRQGEGVGQATVSFRQRDGTPRGLDLRELAWSDLRPSMKQVSIYARLARGGLLCGYWITPLLTRATSRTSASLRGWLLFGTVALLCWYLLVLAAAAQTLWPAVQGYLAPHPAPAASVATGSAGSVTDRLWDAKLLWAAVLATLGLKTLTDGVDVSWTTYAFMKDRDSLRRKLRLRLRGMLSHIGAERQDGQRVLVVAHSFGTVVTADALGAETPGDTKLPPLDLMTLGSPLEFLGYYDAGIERLVDQCLRAGAVRSWLDFYAPEDAFCSRVPLDEVAEGKFSARRIGLGQSRLAAATGQAHNAYFAHHGVLEAILGLSRDGAGG